CLGAGVAHREAAVEAILGRAGRGDAGGEPRAGYPQKYLFFHGFTSPYPLAIHAGCTGMSTNSPYAAASPKSIATTIQPEVAQNECCNRIRVSQGKDRKRGRKRPVGRHGNDGRVTRVQQRLAPTLAVDLELRDRGALETLDQYDIARRQPLERLVQRQFQPPAELVLQCPAHGGRHQHLLATGFAMPERILARLIEIELVMRVLDQRDRQAARDEAWNQLLDKRRLAAAGPAGESEYAHRPFLNGDGGR